MTDKYKVITSDKQTELSNCSFVKTILMIAVVLYHCIVYWRGNWFVIAPIHSAPVLGIFAEWLDSFHIYAFTLVSGYLFYYLKYEAEKYNKFIPFSINKAKRLLVPYIFISAFWAIPFAICFYRYNVSDILIKFGLGTSPHQLWFLLMLFGVFILFYPLSEYFKNNNICGILLALVFYIAGFVGPAIFPNIFQVFRVCSYIPFFLLGFKVRQYGSLCLRKIPSIVWIITDVLLFVLLRYISGFDGIIFKMLNQIVRFFLHIVGALMAFIVLQKIAERCKWKSNKAVAFLNINSMTVYLLHQQVVYLLISLLNGVVNPYIHAGINFICAMGISLLISVLLRKFRWTKFLVGEK